MTSSNNVRNVISTRSSQAKLGFICLRQNLIYCYIQYFWVFQRPEPHFLYRIGHGFRRLSVLFKKKKSANKQDHASIHGDSLPLLMRCSVVSTAPDAQEFSVQVHNLNRISIFIRGKHEIAINNIDEFLDFCKWY